jgi:aquaporin Z
VSAAARPQSATSGWHLVEWSAEFAGTALLLFFGLSAVVLDFAADSPVARVIPSQSVRLLLTGALFACTGSLVAISPLGRRSGGHINPCVTLAFWCMRKVHPHDLIAYVVAQVLGALAGAALVKLAWGMQAVSVDLGVTLPHSGMSPVDAFIVEAGMTALLVLTIYVFVSSMRTARWTPLAVFVLVTVLVWQVAPYTGTSLNPARSLAPALVAPDLRQLWVYIVGPIAGALIAAAGWLLVARRDVVTAKLFHDPAYPSVLGCTLPAKPTSA